MRRPATKPEQLQWDPARPATLPDDTGAVINLCGATIGHRWTKSYKRLIEQSRIVPTTRLAQTVARQGIPVMVSASGVGFYGETGDRVVDEGSGPGDDFLARLAVDWEAATRPAQEAGAAWSGCGRACRWTRAAASSSPSFSPSALASGASWAPSGSGSRGFPWGLAAGGDVCPVR